MTPQGPSEHLPTEDASLAILQVSPVIPVVVLEDADDAVPVARALLRGGVGIIEITLRTPVALEAIRRVAAEVPEMVVGAGTVLTPQQCDDAQRAGAGFVVTPGSPPALVEAVLAAGMPLLAGTSTLTEMMTVLALGHRALKFFPAQQAGGTGYLTAVHGPLPQARFCPTGGITAETAPDFLALPNVACVGGSWLTPRAPVQAGDWAQVEQLAREASALGGSQ
jgi:2-dehydro-3-deoxyphosphogluconate aldolase / (4S)-4-hydroxy-2-oxoglutarate aldolase